MKDERFEWNNIEVINYRKNQRRQEEAWLNQLPNLNLFREKIYQWWYKILSRQDREFGGTELRELGEKLRKDMFNIVNESTSLIVLLEKIFLAIADFNYLDDEPAMRIARRLLAEELGRASASGTASLDKLLNANKYAQRFAGLQYNFFKDSFLQACREDNQKQQSWCRILSSLSSSLSDYLDVADDEHNILDQLHREEERIQHSGSPIQAWQKQYIFIRLNQEVILRLNILAALDHSALLDALEQIPSITILYEIIKCPDFICDRKLIKFALENTPPVFNNHEATGNFTLVPWLWLILEHAKILQQSVAQASNMNYTTPRPAKEELKQLENIELPDWFRTAFLLVLKRHDGERVGVEFAAVLTQEAQRLNINNQQQRWSASYVALYEIIIKLQNQGITLEKVNNIFAHSQSKNSMNFFLVSCEVELHNKENSHPWHINKPEVRQCLWNWYEEMLKDNNEEIQQQVNPYNTVTWPFETTGAVLLTFNDPVAEWRKTWDSLFESRFKARFCLSTSSLDSSLHLIRTGISTITLIVAETQQYTNVNEGESIYSNLLQTLWSIMFEKLQYFIVGKNSYFFESIYYYIDIIFACMPTVFGVNSSTFLTAFQSITPLLQVNEVMAVHAAYFLHRNGIEKQTVHNLFNEYDMNLSDLGEVAKKVICNSESENTLELMLKEMAF